jgi:hypothetical protein
MAVEGISSVTDKEPFDYYQQMLMSSQGKSRAEKGGGQLSPEEQQEVEDLKKRDTEVRQHEQAHLMAGGQYVKGGASYTYKVGPDGNRYAIGGEVQLDATPIADDPQATISKMETIKRAALAPAEPSEQDYRVATQAEQLKMNARQELTEQQTEKMRGAGKASQPPQPNVHQVDWTI